MASEMKMFLKDKEGVTLKLKVLAFVPVLIYQIGLLIYLLISIAPFLVLFEGKDILKEGVVYTVFLTILVTLAIQVFIAPPFILFWWYLGIRNYPIVIKITPSALEIQYILSWFDRKIKRSDSDVYTEIKYGIEFLYLRKKGERFRYKINSKAYNIF